MTRKTIKTLFGLVAAALVAALTIAAGTATAAVGPTITAGTGCAVQCVKKAAVSTTASSAKVELETTVLAVVRVWVAKQTAATRPARSPLAGRRSQALPPRRPGRPRSTVSSRTRPTRSG